jgi:hypothetical protein
MLRRRRAPGRRNLILNGDFAAAATGDPATGWALKTPAVGTETMTISGGTLNLTGDGTNGAYADQSFPTVPGRQYVITQTTGTFAINVNVGTSQGGSQLISANTPGVGTASMSFVATSTTTWLRYLRVAAGTVTIDNVSVI